MLNNKRIKCW